MKSTHVQITFVITHNINQQKTSLNKSKLMDKRIEREVHGKQLLNKHDFSLIWLISLEIHLFLSLNRTELQNEENLFKQCLLGQFLLILSLFIYLFILEAEGH